MALNDEQKKLLHAAIDKAQGFGHCRYVTEGGTARCVVAQLGALCGVTGEELSRWDEGQERFRNVRANNLPGASKLDDYPMGLLDGLQSYWDGNLGVVFEAPKGMTDEQVQQAYEAAVRLRIHRLVDEWPSTLSAPKEG